MGPWSDPGVLALVAGDAPGSTGEPEVSEVDLLAAGGLLGRLEDDPRPSPAVLLGTAPRTRSLAVVFRCLQEARRGSLLSAPHRTALFAQAARRACAYLDPAFLGAERVARLELAVHREVANAHRLHGRFDRARSGLLQVRELMTERRRADDPAEQAEQAAYQSALWASEGRLEVAVNRLEETAGRLQDHHTLLHLRLQVHGGILAGWFDTSRAVELLRLARVGLDTADAPALQRVAALALAWWHSATVDAVAVLDDLPRLRHQVLPSADAWAHAVLLWVEARLLARLELHREAEAGYQRLWSLLFEQDHRPELVLATGELLAVLAQLDKRQEAAQTVAALGNLLAVWKTALPLQDRWHALLDLLDRPAELEAESRRLAGRLQRGPSRYEVDG